MAVHRTLREFDAAAYSLTARQSERTPAAVRKDLLALAGAAGLNDVQARIAVASDDQLMREVPGWVGRMRRQVAKRTLERPPHVDATRRPAVLHGARLDAAAREPFCALRRAASNTPGRTQVDLVTARADALMRIPQIRTVRDYIDVLVAQLDELLRLSPEACDALIAARPQLLSKCAAVMRALTQRAAETTRPTIEQARLLSRTAARHPAFAEIGLAALSTVAHLETLPIVTNVAPIASSRPGSRVQKAVIAGAGPAGLAAAIELLQRGVCVDLVDARDPWEYTRPVQMVVKVHALDQLAHLGVLERLKPHLSPIGAEVDDGPNHLRAKPVIIPRPPDAHRATRSGGEFARSSSVFIVSLHELESALFDRALTLGARVIANASVELSRRIGKGATSYYEVCAMRGVAKGRAFSKTGERISLGVPDLVVIAEGSRSERRIDFGVGWTKDEHPPKHGLAGLVRVDIGPETRTWSESANADVDVVLSVGHIATGNTWTIVEAPDEKLINDPKSAERFFLERSGRALGKELESRDLIFGGRSLFPIENRIADTAAFFVSERQAVLAVGDAKGLGSPAFGLGMQYGISVDAMNIGRFVDGVDDLGMRQASLIFDAAIRDSVRAWHALWN